MRIINLPVIFSHIPEKNNRFILQKPIKVDLDDKLLIINKGFYTDGASVPKILWSIFPPVSGRYLEAAFVHDALYCSQLLTKEEADKIFLELMRQLNVNWVKRQLMYCAVKLFGRFAWKKHIKNGSMKKCREKVFLIKDTK